MRETCNEEDVQLNIKSVFIVWANRSRRAETLAAELNGQISFQYETNLTGLLTPIRYVVQSWKTWRLLNQRQPEAVLVQSPPIFASLVVALWCELRSRSKPLGQCVHYAIDCHTSTFYSNKWRWALPVLRILARRATVILYHNEGAKNILQNWKVRSVFLIDGVPSLSIPTSSIGSEGETRVAAITTLESENIEPIIELFAAARLLPQVTFYVTGDPQRALTKLLEQKPENVTLTGFLRGGNYTALLTNVDGLVILTKQPQDLSCAAYEAVAVAKPAVISNSANKHLFTRGFIYVNNTPEEIAAGIEKMLNEQEMLIPEVITMRAELANRRQPNFEEFVRLLTSNSTVQPSEDPIDIVVNR